METNWFDLAKKICNPPMEKPQQYRILAPDEVKLQGDEYTTTLGFLSGVNAWIEAPATFLAMVNNTPVLNAEFKFRRPIPVAKSERVNTFEDPWAVPTVKESLSVEDESSDNSRSFQEIKILGEEVEMWKKLYTKECELRRQAERERDEAKEKHKNIMDLWRMMKHWMIGEGPQEAFRFSDAVRQAKGDVVKTWLKIITSFWREIRELKKERDTLRANETRLREAIRDMLIKAHESCDEATEMELERIAALAGKGEK